MTGYGTTRFIPVTRVRTTRAPLLLGWMATQPTAKRLKRPRRQLICGCARNQIRAGIFQPAELQLARLFGHAGRLRPTRALEQRISLALMHLAEEFTLAPMMARCKRNHGRFSAVTLRNVILPTGVALSPILPPVLSTLPTFT